MNGPHDMGGRQGFGSIERDDGTGVPFPDRWQAAVFTIVNGMMRSGVVCNVDQFRHAVERIDPVSYLTDTYYGRWLGGIETLLVEAGVITRTELNDQSQALGADPRARVAARPTEAPNAMPPAEEDQPSTAYRPDAGAPCFEVGDAVRTIRSNTAGHTRLPGYAQGVVGRIIASHGTWVYPDSNAHGRGEHPQPLYSVAFSGTDLWGEDAEPGLSVSIDLFEPYLRAVE